MREKTSYLLRTRFTKVSHLVSFEVLSGLVPRPLARYKSNWSTRFRHFEHSCNGWAWARKLTPQRWNRKKVDEEDTFDHIWTNLLTFLLTLIHCMSAQNIQREWISLTCTWLVVWGRVQIRIQRRLSRHSSQQPFFSLFPSPLLARKHHLETFESRTARALAPFVLLLLVSMLI